jgi:two-component system sensor histidine kinase HydH
MFARNPQLRFLRPVALTSLLLVGLCVFTAVFLHRQQAGATEALRENLLSRRAAADLEESLTDLVGLLRERVDRVRFIHEQIDKHLASIRHFADKPKERQLANELSASYDRYSELWREAHAPGADREAGLGEAALHLEGETLPACQRLVEFNTGQIEHSEEEHRQSLRRLAWGMGAVGVTGAAAGLFLGYGVARTLSQTIRRLQVGLRDAAGKLGPDVTEIVLTGEGELGRLEGQVQELMARIEQVVGKLQQREREVLRAEQLAAVGQLAAGVAHEIRNPLTSIKMLVQAGREDSAGLPAEDLEVIEREVQRMERSLKVFLDFARLPKPERTAQDLAALAGQTLDLVRGRAAKQHVELRLSCPPGPVRVEADGEQVRQVLVNLALNALDVMPAGGRLEVVVKPSAAGVEVSVLDTGPGVAAAMMPRLFEPFVSTKETGLGLGLVISRRIAEEHGGRLRAVNRPEGGACFTLNLPVGS